MVGTALGRVFRRHIEIQAVGAQKSTEQVVAAHVRRTIEPVEGDEALTVL